MNKIDFEKYYGRYSTSCRICDSSNLYEFLDLGYTPPADEFRSKKELQQPYINYPLGVNICDDCGLVQLNYVVNPEILYQNNYPYESSITSTGKIHWDEFAKSVVERFGLKSDSLVVDIGSNVGVLLSSFKQLGMKVQGIDPAQGIVDIANKSGINTECSFFNEQVVDKIIDLHGPASVVTGSNVVAHIDDLKHFIKVLDRLLAEEGIFIFEAPYLVELFKSLEYDTIYHEHLSYLSIKPLIRLFNNHGFEIFDIHEREIHGGTIRVYVCRTGKYINTGKSKEYVDIEIKEGIYSHKYLDKFSREVYENRASLRKVLYQLKQENKKIAAVSAPAKGMTLLNYCGIGIQELDFITEKSALKKGKYIPGGQLEVLDDSALIEHEIDYALLLAWNFSNEIMNNLEEYKAQGGKFIIPIPSPKII